MVNNMFISNLFKRANRAIALRIECDKKINYTFRNYYTLGTIIELRLIIVDILLNHKINGYRKNLVN